ncbi:MAG: glycosyltransferase, partial [Chloroflexi bacterium]
GERTPQLSVVVPTRNEAGNISALDQRLSEALIGIDYEVLVVDDSNDSLTRPALRATAQRNPAWTVIERSPLHQTGLATAVVTG